MGFMDKNAKIKKSKIDNVDLDVQRPMSDLIGEMKLCEEACKMYEGKDVDQVFSGPVNHRADWIALFAAEMVGKPGWPTAKQIANECVREIELVSEYYPSGETWVPDSVQSIKDWISGSVTDEEIAILFRTNFERIRAISAVNTSEDEILRAVVNLTKGANDPSSFFGVAQHVAKAVGLDPSKSNTKKQELEAIAQRLNIDQFLNQDIRDQIQ